MSYDNNLSKFSVYAYTCMFTAVYSEKRKEKLSKTIPGHQIIYYQTEHDDGDGNTSNLMNLIPSKENVEEEALSEVMFIEFSKKLKNRDKVIFSMFRAGYKQGEIGEKVGCSQAQVSRVKKKLLQYLENRTTK